MRLIARNQLLLTAKYFSGLSRWPIVAGQLLWGLVALCHGCAGAYLQGKMAGVRVVRSLPQQRLASGNKIEAFVRESEQTILRFSGRLGSTVTGGPISGCWGCNRHLQLGGGDLELPRRAG